MIELLNKIGRAYRSGGMAEVRQRAYHKYVQGASQEYFPISKLPFLLDYYVNKEHRRVNETIKNFCVPESVRCMNKSHLTKYKSSNTLFILASGGSINQISDAQWGVIDEHDSVGLNRWPIHEFVPTYHVFELPDPRYEAMQRKFLELLEYRKDSYSDTPMIIKDVTRTPDVYRSLDVQSHVAGNLLLSRDSAFLKVGSGEEPQRRLLQCLFSSGYFTPGGSFELIYRVRASISYLINFAVLMNYEQIVLCGVDMVNSRYFFTHDKYQSSDIPIPQPNIENTDKTHPTNDSQRGRITLEKLIYVIDETILQPNNIELFVENTVSALHPRVPVYTYE